MAKKFTSLVLDKTRNIRYGMVAMTRIENKLGKPFNNIDFEDGMTFGEVAVVLWAGMVHEDAELTPDKVAELVDEYSDITTAMAAMAEAMGEAFGTSKNARTAVVVNAGNGTGILPSETPSSAVSCPISSGN